MQPTIVDVPTPDGTADAYLARPDSGGPFPGVLLFMDAFGLRPRLAEMAATIADRGYVVLAPNLFHRAGPTQPVDMSALADESRRAELFGRVGPMMAALTPDAVARDTAAYLDFLAAQPGVAPGPAAITGYCMGGTNALRAIEALPDRIAAVAAFHAGHVVTDAPDSPHRGVGAVTGELYFGHADQDGSMTADQIAVLEKALDAAGVTYRSEVYAGARHGYTQADTPMYDERATERHWAALFDLLDRTFRG
ncbi:dienelactone hydrolase family protein [Micromonospora sp. WMMD1128]|uniref:dienelactone hydrolase family protein n=1 Tax=unclassified Micromonospora TaxID=2617518 RepID=UPI00248B1533|nr:MULTISPECIES: dienelactone hydrolase family protein [unclassified Micromonospora]WBB76412.1 dienelactone hydrolase family protein [Micromonospora sp. WMMD1128]WFE35802.1 dienelactone hydrolase family protein [Micromonospora sp. WMMD975]